MSSIPNHILKFECDSRIDRVRFCYLKKSLSEVFGCTKLLKKGSINIIWFLLIASLFLVLHFYKAKLENLPQFCNNLSKRKLHFAIKTSDKLSVNIDLVYSLSN